MEFNVTEWNSYKIVYKKGKDSSQTRCNFQNDVMMGAPKFQMDGWQSLINRRCAHAQCASHTHINQPSERNHLIHANSPTGSTRLMRCNRQIGFIRRNFFLFLQDTHTRYIARGFIWVTGIAASWGAAFCTLLVYCGTQTKPTSSMTVCCENSVFNGTVRRNPLTKGRMILSN